MAREVIACKGIRIKISDNVIDTVSENVFENYKQKFRQEYPVYGIK
jgi:hypothetical protein